MVTGLLLLGTVGDALTMPVCDPTVAIVVSDEVQFPNWVTLSVLPLV